MIEFTAVGRSIQVSPVKKVLSCRGNSNTDAVCFTVGRYCGDTDLLPCGCTVKTKNSAGKSDVVLPEVQAEDDKLKIVWNVSSATTSAAGLLLVQLQFEKIFDDNSKNIVWQSEVMEFEIADSLDSADEVSDQNPTLFQQWEDQVNTVYSEISADLQSVQSLQSQAKTDADSAAASALSAQNAAEAAAQKADSFSGYTKQEIDNGFANTFLGTSEGQTVTLPDVQSGTLPRSLTVGGQTQESGSGAKGPDHPYSLLGTTKITVSDGAASQDYPLPAALFSLPDGTCDTLEAVSGKAVRNVGEFVLDGTQTLSTWTGTSLTFGVYFTVPGLEAGSYYAAGPAYCTHFGSIPPVTLNSTDYLNAAISIWDSGQHIMMRVPFSTFGGNSSNSPEQNLPLLQSWLSAQKTAGTPVTILYRLASGTQTAEQPLQIAALNANAAIAADRGTVEIKYCRDSNAVYQELIAKIEALHS